MPWENKGGGGPWGGGDGGSGGKGGGGGGPWGGGGGGGGGPWGGGGGPGGRRPPDIEDMIRRGQDRFKRAMPSGRGLGPIGITVILLAIISVWIISGFYRVQNNERGVEMIFGRHADTTDPGLHWNWPFPVGAVLQPEVTTIHQIDIGFQRFGRGGTQEQKRDVSEESLMLTGDQNIIDIDFSVFWKISDPFLFLFKIRNPQDTVKIAAESAMREIIGRTDIQPALTEGRGTVEASVKLQLQTILDEYESGILITDLNLQDVKPPQPVIDAFDDVQRARQDRERLRNEADKYRNDILPRARGEAQRTVQGAEAYKERLVNEAEGEAERFLSVFRAYQENPQVTRRRMYLETIQQVLGDSDKVILDSSIKGAVPYLPLNELRRGSGGQ